MDFLHLVVLSVIQGITEFLPVSSSGHLALFPLLTHWVDQGPFIDVALHVGSLGAVLIYFRSDVVQIFIGLFDLLRGRMTKWAKITLYLGLASIPLFIFGFIALKGGYVTLWRTLEVIAWTNIIFAALLYFGDRYGAEIHKVEGLTLRQAMIVGLAQAVALIPGVSRSGITMTFSRFLGFERVEAARLAMLLAIPGILGTGAGALLDAVETGAAGVGLTDVLLALILSFAAAYLAIALMIRLLDKMSFTPFVIYRVVLGLFLFWLVYA